METVKVCMWVLYQGLWNSKSKKKIFWITKVCLNPKGTPLEGCEKCRRKDLNPPKKRKKTRRFYLPVFLCVFVLFTLSLPLRIFVVCILKAVFFWKSISILRISKVMWVFCFIFFTVWYLQIYFFVEFVSGR